MARGIVGLVVFFATFFSSVPALGQTDEAPPGEWSFLVAPALIEEISILGELGAFESNETVELIVQWTDAPPTARDALLLDLSIVDGDVAALRDLGSTEFLRGLSAPARLALGRIPDGVLARIRAGDEGFLDPEPWLSAATDVVVRRGRAPEVRSTDEFEVIIELLDRVDSEGTAEGSALRGSDGAPVGLWIALAAGATVVVLGVVAVRRRRSGGRARAKSTNELTDVLETTRLLTEALDVAEVQRIAVAESMRLTGADSGAFVSRQAGRTEFAVTMGDVGFAPRPSPKGALGRVLDAGQNIHVVGPDDSLAEQQALAAAPVIANGGVSGAIVVTRSPESPFDAGTLQALDMIAPIVGSALRSAAAHSSAVIAADRDGLTDLHNRRRLDHDLAAIGDSETVGFAMIDVDFFKRFNDSYGHRAGDEALRLVADAIKRHVRSGDSVYRYGGEEFSVLLPGCSRDEAAEVMERVRGAVEELDLSDVTGERSAGITISVGLASGEGYVADPVTRSADAALYVAKDRGRNQVVVAD